MSTRRTLTRDTAALFVRYGRLIGEAEATERLASRYAKAEHAAAINREVTALRTGAERARADAERLLAELQSPGARLGRRVVAAIRAAAAAFRQG